MGSYDYFAYNENYKDKITKKYRYCAIFLIAFLIALMLYGFIYGYEHPKPTKLPLYHCEKRYSLQFAAEKVRPSQGEARAFGYGYIQMSNHTEYAKVCWSFTAIGLVKYVEKLSIHGPLTGNGEHGVHTDIFIDLDTSYVSNRYAGCVTAVENKQINQIYKDPSRFYLLCSTSAHPSGAMWANLGGQWDVIEPITFKNVTVQDNKH